MEKSSSLRLKLIRVHCIGGAVSIKGTAELSFITSASATSTQDPNERVIFQRMEEQTNVHIDWTCFVSDQSLIRRIWRLHNLEICQMDYSMPE